jgi:hypothetical protein
VKRGREQWVAPWVKRHGLHYGWTVGGCVRVEVRRGRVTSSMERAHSIDCVLRFAPSELGTYLVREGGKRGRVGTVTDSMYGWWWGDVVGLGCN